MPYRIGAKGSSGCSGYPAVKDTGEVMGCHKTRREAAAQIYAIIMNDDLLIELLKNKNKKL